MPTSISVEMQVENIYMHGSEGHQQPIQYQHQHQYRIDGGREGSSGDKEFVHKEGW